jgi:hypothetical protein
VFATTLCCWHVISAASKSLLHVLVQIAGFIGGTLADVRVWLLVIGLLLLHYRKRGSKPHKDA